MLEQKSAEDFRVMTVDKTIALLHSDSVSGLKQDEAEKRLKRDGYNEVPEKRANPAFRFLKKFWGLTAWMLEAIIFLSWFLHKISDAYIVIGLLIFNAVISFAQEQNAAGAVEALKKKLQVNAKILRDGAWNMIPARELVSGDVLRIRTGDFVPADVKVIRGEIGVDQSALTGESTESEKKPGDILYSGSIVSRGEATGIIVSTGVKTYFGKTVQLVQIARPKLHIETIISKVTQGLLLIVAVLLSVAFAVSFIKGIPILEVLPLMLVLLLGAIPVALPAMFTVSMALGSQELVRKGVLVTRLSAPDDAARMDILYVDKTGTLTANRMAVAQVMALNNFAENEALLCGALASQEANADSADLAFISAARQKNLSVDSFVQKSFVPFDPKTRRTEAVIAKDSREFSVMKGSVGAVAQACSLDTKQTADLEAKAFEFAKNGYRTLAVAKAENKNQYRPVGLVALHDPPRSDSKKSVEELKELGVSVKMLTGDALPIAREIAAEVGIGTKIVRASELKVLNETDPAKAAALIEGSDGISEIYPEDKYLIVKNTQAKKHIVGMTGDGVNDAPALKQAEVGTAVSTATDVAKAAASIVLTGEGLANVIMPIKTGRMMFCRINTWILNKISRTVLKTCFVVFAFLVTGKYVISASAMLIMIFMTDFVKISLATDNVRWSRKPDVWDINALTKIGAILGLLMVIEAFGLLAFGWHFFNLKTNNGALGTFSFEILLYFALFSIFVVREKGNFWNSIPSKTLLGLIVLDMSAGIIFCSFGLLGFKPIPIAWTLAAIGYAFLFSLVINDFIKTGLLKKI